jgi:DNA-binding transcriptional MerR regulator
VVKGGQTVSATRFAELTGVSRERLRTWERRYGFPRPERAGRGPRRYALADARLVVAVRRAAEEGIPLPDAIDRARTRYKHEVAARETLAAIPEYVPAPLLVISGPAPTRIEYVNPALAERPRAPLPGTELAEAASWYRGSECERAVQALFTGEERLRECAHPSWLGRPEDESRSILFRLPAQPPDQPLVAMIELGRPRERETRRALAELRSEHEGVAARLARHERWLIAIAELAELFQRESATALLQATADTLVRRLPPIDAGVAIYMGGELALGSSSRGLLGPRMVTVTAHEDLAAVLRDGTPAWLGPASAAAFGAPAGVHVLGVPVAVVGETLGALLLVMEEPGAIEAEIPQLLTVLSAALGFALLRDRLLQGTRDAAS